MVSFHSNLITESALRTIVKEEIENQLLIEELNLISEYTIKNFALDLAGLVPGIGEPADIINGIDLAKQGDYIGSALSFVSMIPVKGDLVGKGGKLAMLAGKAQMKAVAFALAKIMPHARKFFKVIVTKFGNKFPALKKLMPKLEDTLENFVKEQTGEAVDQVAKKAKEVGNEQIKAALEKKDKDAIADIEKAANGEQKTQAAV